MFDIGPRLKKNVSRICAKEGRPYLEKRADMGELFGDGGLQRGKRESASAPKVGEKDEKILRVSRQGVLCRDKGTTRAEKRAI